MRPSRRTQGSRNPLRALAAREDIRQDYMGDRANMASEERIQAENSECFCIWKCIISSLFLANPPHPPPILTLPCLCFYTESKNSSESHLSGPEGVISPSESHPPFSSLMLLHIKGHKKDGAHLLPPDESSCFNYWCLW